MEKIGPYSERTYRQLILPLFVHLLIQAVPIQDVPVVFPDFRRSKGATQADRARIFHVASFRASFCLAIEASPVWMVGFGLRFGSGSPMLALAVASVVGVMGI